LNSDGVPVFLRVVLELLDALGSNISLHDFLKQSHLLSQTDSVRLSHYFNLLKNTLTDHPFYLTGGVIT